MSRLLDRMRGVVWTRELITLAGAVFINNFGQGLLGGASMNFFIHTLGLSGAQVLWLEGIRELPGLGLMFIAALTMRIALCRRGTLALMIMGIGYILYGVANSYITLLIVAVIASLGMHMWMPVLPSLGMAMTTKDRSGRVMGAVQSVAALAALTGMGAVGILSRLLQSWPLNVYYFAGGACILVASLVLTRLPCTLGATKAVQPRMLLKRRYWLYYVLTFFEGSRKEVLGTFVTLVLVQNFGLKVYQISTLLVISGALNFVSAPYLGYLIDRYGERRMLSLSYAGLTLGCICYGLIHELWLLVPLFMSIKLLILLGMGLSTYVNRIAPPEELTPTLSAGISINHVTSVAMPLVAGALLPLIGYSGVFIGTAALIALSIPFALAMRGARPPLLQPESAAAD